MLAKLMVGNRSVIGLLSNERRMPMTWGIHRPVIVFPSEFMAWSPERRRLVMSHELAHVRRYDCLFQSLAQIMRSLHWFNPLAWWALRQVRLEQEQACDDYVLNQGVESHRLWRPTLLSVTANPGGFPVGFGGSTGDESSHRAGTPLGSDPRSKPEIAGRLRKDELCWL